MKIEIRKAKASDIKKITELGIKQNLLHRKFEPTFCIPADNLERKLIKFYKDKLKNKNNYLLVATDKDEVIGFIDGEVKERPFRKVKKYGLLREIFIEKEYRGKKVGARITRELISWFKSKGLSYVELGVYSKNKHAIIFYKRTGFREFEKSFKKNI